MSNNMTVSEYANSLIQAEQRAIPINWKLAFLDVLGPTAIALETRVQELEDKLKAAELVIDEVNYREMGDGDDNQD